MSRTITIDPVTRIEGHARVILGLDDGGAVSSAALIVNELRGFERILVGMRAEQMPLVTARICGVCPSAHHLAAAKALDAAAGVEIPPAARMLRELLYMGHVIHSHALGLFALEAPDLVFGYDADPAKRNIVGLVEAVPDVAKKALRLRSLGQKINEAVGGRGVHPVTAVVGGMSFRLADEPRRDLEKWAAEALAVTRELLGTTKALLEAHLQRSPQLGDKLGAPTLYMGTVAHGALNFYDGPLRVIDTAARPVAEFESRDYAEHLVERTLDWSYMKPVAMSFGGKEYPYRVGTLARINAADRMETPLAQAELEAFRAAHGRPCHQAVMQVHARLIELLYACEKALALASDRAILGESRVPARFGGSRGVDHVEAPRGTLIHDYQIDDQGIVRAANLIVATQQNYSSINRSIQQAAEAAVESGASDEVLLAAVEFGIRCYDPCLSCATHAVGRMPIEIELTQGAEVRRRVRRS